MGRDGLRTFEAAFGDAMVAAATTVDEAATLVEILQFRSTFPCFVHAPHAVRDFRRRHHAHLDEAGLRAKAKALVRRSANHAGTYLYDVFQRKTNGVAY